MQLHAVAIILKPTLYVAAHIIVRVTRAVFE